MDESRQCARKGNDAVARTPAEEGRSPMTDAAAATKIAELQEELEALKQSHNLVVGELNDKVEELEAKVDALQAQNESQKCEIKGLKSALQWAYALLKKYPQIIKDLRMGTESDDNGESIDIDIDFDLLDEDGRFIRADHDELLIPYWKEFAAALMQWSEYHVDGKYLNVCIYCIELPKSVLDILRPAFKESRIKDVYFENSHHAGDMADFAKKVLQANHFITEVDFGEIKFAREDVKAICYAIKLRNTGDHFINGFGMTDCFDDGIDTHTLKTILESTSGSANEAELSLRGNRMSSREAAVIAEFLNSNPSLAHLRLDDNQFDDTDAAVLANSLLRNSFLRRISVENNGMKENGRLTFLRAVFDVSSLSSCAASNHTCRVYGIERDISVLNSYGSVSQNKWRKIFAMLTLSGEESFINTALLRDVPAQLIPVILDKCTDKITKPNRELTDLYLELTNATRCQKHDVWDSLEETKTLNCMYNLTKSRVVPSIFV
ncbi:hypothetical protein THAOC_19849 [Thalassiosira oceanica]|uniref:Uncharacterized protein n=1 Tax=Thalassiosira oceanica TaxID=159749 RepID=K0SG05_THAOC|nr:hypothetical protein THAOC_19849 [Thalassiosira oceanica]|eukprot:EJK59876.1 hypothetical protein THAOC_19849 [Thalassiosira oceanica]